MNKQNKEDSLWSAVTLFQNVDDLIDSILPYIGLPFGGFSREDSSHVTSPTAEAHVRLELTPWQCFSNPGMTFNAPVLELSSHLSLHTAEPPFGSSCTAM